MRYSERNCVRRDFAAKKPPSCWPDIENKNRCNLFDLNFVSLHFFAIHLRWSLLQCLFSSFLLYVGFETVFKDIRLKAIAPERCDFEASV
mmetsp:Transcript_12359/g.18487  ORF Transcript_12359/g.18487 Transcript_12359/m.18487 type:complete len:90 (-) Transcript_12359:494-763(-)